MNFRLSPSDNRELVLRTDDVTRRMHMDHSQLAFLSRMNPGLEWLDPPAWEAQAKGNPSAEQSVQAMIRVIAERLQLTQANLDWRMR